MRILIVAIFGLAACNNPIEKTEPLPPPPIASEAPRTAQSSNPYLGRWDVLRFEKDTLDTRGGAYVDIFDRSVAMRLRCNYSSANVVLEEGRLAPIDGLPLPTTEMGCSPDRHAQDERFFDFFLQSPTITALDKGRLLLRAGTTELVLQDPAIRRLDFAPTQSQLEGRWTFRFLTRTHAGGGSSGSSLTDEPIVLRIEPSRAWFTACPNLAIDYVYADDRRLVSGSKITADQREHCPLATIADAGLDPLTGVRLLDILHGDPSAELAADGSLVLTSGDYTLELVRQP